MLTHRFRHLIESEAPEWTPVGTASYGSDNFVRCPIAFDPVQQARIESIYSIAAGLIREEQARQRRERRYEFSTN